ncbi:MAG TPA: ABC transporter permease, partial [Rhodothermales bacterium]|nr:ABC transporter permease [Rhodothermales bacterium]
MFWNYVRTAFRQLRKHKAYASINILGLAIGLAGCLLILRYVTDELGYDSFHEHGEQIYRMNWDFNWAGSEGVGPGTPPPLAARLEADIPEVVKATRVYPVSPMVVRHRDRFFVEDRIRAVDPTFLDVFSFDMTSGNPTEALNAPNSVVLTTETARKYFGEESPIGKTITIGESGEFLGRPYSETFTVTAIVADPSQNSHIEFDLLTSMSSHPQVAYFDWSWVWMQVVTYAVVSPAASIADLEGKLVDVVATHAPDAFRRVGFSYDDLIASGGRWNFVFQPLSDVYLGSADIGNRLGPIGNRDYLTIFSIIAGFILLIGCINFMNLATARSVTRAKEIGVRKVLGSVRRSLMGQFMTEAMMYAVLAMLLAIGIAALLIGPFGDLTGKELEWTLLHPTWLPAAIVILTGLVGFLAGSYPSLYLSAFRPIEVLKTRLTTGRDGISLRHGLVVFQFAISITLIACTLIVQKQIRFFGETDLGFDKESVLVVSNQNHRLGDQAAVFKEEAERRAGVVSASLTTGVPPYYGFQDQYEPEGRDGERLDLISYMVDNDFEEALDIDIIEGRGFSDEFETNATSVILNETAVARIGWEEPIGRIVTYPGGQATYTVIGVMRDFNFLSMRQPIVPFALFHEASESYGIPDSYVVVRVRPDDLEATIANLQSDWERIAPGTPFEFSFLDENLDAEYRAEQRLGSLFLIFAGVAIFIACLGLLGLAAFTVQRRTKE